MTHAIGQVTTRGKHPPADIKTEAERHMATVNSGSMPAERIVTIADFVNGCTCHGLKAQATLDREGLSGTSGKTI